MDDEMKPEGDMPMEGEGKKCEGMPEGEGKKCEGMPEGEGMPAEEPAA